ncbi:transcription-repair coupling factor [Chloroflexota bacterium]
MDFSKLLQLIEEMPTYRQLNEESEQNDGNTRVSVPETAKPYLLASLRQRLPVSILLITAHPENSRKLYEQLLTWCPSAEVKLFPEPDALLYERVDSDPFTELERLQVLSTLAGVPNDNNISTVLPPLIVSSAAALMQKVIPCADFTAAVHSVMVGMEIEPFQLLNRWQVMGYRLEGMVETPGTISHRGGIIDIFPLTSHLPARLEFFGNSIESIRLFDPLSQRSQETVHSIILTPATELILSPDEQKKPGTYLRNIDMSALNSEAREQFRQELSILNNNVRLNNPHFYSPLFQRDNLLDYLPEDSLLILDEPRSIKLAIEDIEEKTEELRSEKVNRKDVPPDFPSVYFTWNELDSRIKGRRCLSLTSFGVTENEKCHELNFAPAPSYAGQLPLFIKKAREMLEQGQRLILVSHQASRISELLEEEDIFVPPLNEIRQVPPHGSLILLQGLLDGGWIMNSDTYLFTDSEIFGYIKQSRLLKKRPVQHQRLLIDIAPGDFIVHIEHGIARFAGITTMGAGGEGEKEYLVLEYAGDDKLYVPSDQIDRVGRYVGAGENSPVLSRLGTQEWTRARQRVKKAVTEIASELIALYASREIEPGFTFSPDTVWQREVEASFPYVETPDQLEVLRQVKEDMEDSKPMDRLVCGDVGYGKTEIAVRATFKAVMDGKQVAILSPTTVLAEQHFATFSQRLSAFPVTIEVLSRFRSHKEQKAILAGTANGNVDICIGTHRLLQKDVAFKELGLLVIDEEQRFGVAHKEYLKQMRKEVDVLTLSATPIPRTLHMSLVGVRDMSVMETPPEERLPIKTYVSEFNDYLVREAILRELERDGQIFFVHNRVQSIGLVAEKLQKLLPEARIAIGHGQMQEGELEKVMTSFIQGKSDILVCSSIIQSGLDMPNVNTLIINQADKFGLTQLYQLRGRVGRGANLAYAYLLFDKGKRLTPIAEKRLKTITEATELGAGFGIAMKDLEIRGAGTLLGMRQSGHISAVGFNLYCQMLAQAVEDQKARRAGVSEREITPPLPPPSVDLPLPAFIPTEYVDDLLTRLELYQKLARLEEVKQLEPVAREFEDRFGKPPPEIENLLYAVRIKILATKAGIESVSTERGEIVLRPFEGMRFEKEKITPLRRDGLQTSAFQIRINPKRLGRIWQRVLEELVTELG